MEPGTAQVLSTGVSTGGGFLGALVNRKTQRDAQKRAIRHNERLAAEQRAWNERMWHMANEYNAPKSQMERLKEAKLNPRLVYGQSSGAAAGHAGDVKGYDRAHAESLERGIDFFGDFQKIMSTSLAAQDLAANVKVKKQQEILTAAQAASQTLQNLEQASKIPYLKELARINFDAAAENLERIIKENQLTDIQIEVAKATKDTKIEQAKTDLIRSLQNVDIGEAEKVIKNWHAKLAQEGLSPTDNLILRQLGTRYTASQLFDVAENLTGMDKVDLMILASMMVGPTGAARGFGKLLWKAAKKVFKP